MLVSCRAISSGIWLATRAAVVVFEAVPPFRGLEVRGLSEFFEGDVTQVREDIAGRFLGIDDGRRFAAARTSKPGVLLRLYGG